MDSGEAGPRYREPALLFLNQRDGTFRNISKLVGPALQLQRVSRGVAIGDLFNDGRVEAVINNLSDRPMLLVNLARNQNHWLGLRLVGTSSNRDAIGARVTLQGTKRVWVDEVRSGSSYNSSSDLRLHFGLGTETQLKAIHVRWPNGKVELFDPPSTLDHFLDLVEGKGRPPTP